MKSILTVTIAALALTACSQPESAVETPMAEKSATPLTGGQSLTTISWEELMPEGEDKRLEALYAEFYDDLEKQYQQNETTLMQSGDETDISSLIPEGSADDSMEQIGTFNVVEGLDGKAVRIPGYVVPFNFSRTSEYDEFLLVPYFGACLHTPPPPPNQIVFVKSSPAAKVASIYEPVWLEGTLKTGKFTSELGNSAYELELSKIEPYEY